MTNHVLILGADMKENNLILSCAAENQKDIFHENYPLDDQEDVEKLTEIISTFLKKHFERDDAEYVVYSCDKQPRSRCKAMEKSLRQHGIGRMGIRLISRENAFVHYVMGQKEELHRHTVIGFDFDGQELWGYRLYHPNKKNKKEMKTEKKSIASFTLTGGAEESGFILDQKFEEITKAILTKEVVSAVFLTGNGFEGNWMKKSLKVLCDGRRAFFGQNLFSLGCCFYGNLICSEMKGDYTIQAPENVMYEAGVTDSGSEDSFVKITDAGIPWYEAKGSIDVIMERGGKADVVFVHAQTKEKQVESVDISGLPMRPRKTGRLTITVEFMDNQKGVITVLDKGFGAFSPATHQVFFKEFQLL